jgi:U3 small nucleolar RNA-associated protein 12
VAPALQLVADCACAGVLASPTSNVLFDSTGKLVVAPTLESVSVWNIKQGALAHSMPSGDKAEVTVMAGSPDKKHFAVGYADGRIRIWDVYTKTSDLTLNGHK